MNYSANDIQTLSPGRAYRERLGMYLSADLQEAMDLGLRELVYNAQDEYAATNQKDAFIKITINTTTNEIIAEDNMRGIPVGMPDGGAFISQFKSSLTRTFNSLAKKKFDGDSIRNMLDGYVSVKVRVGQFSNQAKTALANKEAATATSAAITDALKQFATTRANDFNMVVTMLEKIEKAEAAADKARNAVLNFEKKEVEQKKQKITSSDKFKDCEKHGQDSMLIICEGETN